MNLPGGAVGPVVVVGRVVPDGLLDEATTAELNIYDFNETIASLIVQT